MHGNTDKVRTKEEKEITLKTNAKGTGLKLKAKEENNCNDVVYP